MRKSSKALWIALIVVALVCVMALGAMAASATDTTAVIYGSTIDVTDQQTFDVEIMLKDNDKNIECGKITLTWNKDKMKATAIAADTALASAQFESDYDNDSGKAVIAWAGSNISAPTGKLFKVTFEKESGFVAGDAAAVDIEVNNLGSANWLVRTDYAENVTANRAFASVPSPTMTFNEGDDAVEVLTSAVTNAELVGGDNTVTLTLNSNMTFSANTIIGEELEAAPVGKVVIQSAVDTDGAPLYGITVENNAVVTFYGSIEFKNIILGSAAETRYNNGLLFPDNAHGAFVEGIVRPTETVIEGEGESATEKTIEKKLNLAGNVTVSSGKYLHIVGNFHKSGVGETGEQVKGPAVSGATIILQGDATTVLLFGGGLEDGAEVTAKSTIKILGGASVTDEVVGGARYSGNNGSEGADIYVDTTGTIEQLTVGCLGNYNEDSTFNLYMTGGTVKKLYAQRMNDGGTIGSENTVINMYIDGGTVNNAYVGLRAWYSAGKAGSVTANGVINFYYNQRERECNISSNSR